MADAIVFTTINSPTAALRKWALLDGYRLFGVGDRRTPGHWNLDGCTFLSAAEQTGELAELLPWGHYCRKNLGYVQAIASGANVIVDTDDDNAPRSDWRVLPFDAKYEVAIEREWVNAYYLFAPATMPVGIWPRGFPLNRLLDPPPPDSEWNQLNVKVGVWQGLVNGEPDVDAIYRLLHGPKWFTFAERVPIVMALRSACPFNSQNTAFRRELFPLLYLPAVEFRFTDILRSLVAQPIMWQMGYHLGFTRATATQDRNPHDIMADFRSEMPCYLHAEAIPQIVAGALNPEATLAANLMAAYGALADRRIVMAEELPRVRAWLDAIGER